MNKRDKEKYDRLHNRIRDIYRGATSGTDPDEEHDFVCAGSLSRFMLALRETFRLTGDKEYLVGCHMLEYYETAEKATEVLWTAGIRP